MSTDRLTEAQARTLRAIAAGGTWTDMVARAQNRRGLRIKAGHRAAFSRTTEALRQLRLVRWDDMTGDPVLTDARRAALDAQP